MHYLVKLKTSIPHDPAILFLDVYDTHIYKGTYTIMFIVAFLLAPNWKDSRCLSVIEWKNKLWYVHPAEYYIETRMNEQNVDEFHKHKAKRKHKIHYGSIYIKFKIK